VRGIIVAEYRAPLPALYSATSATFTGIGGFSTCLDLDWQAASRPRRKRVPPTAHILNVFLFIGYYPGGSIDDESKRIVIGLINTISNIIPAQ
jgi:hypothetical protein